MLENSCEEESGNRISEVVVREPRLYLDVNITNGVKACLTIYEGDNVHAVVNKFSEDYSLSDLKRIKLLTAIENQLSLPRVTEEDEQQSYNTTM